MGGAPSIEIQLDGNGPFMTGKQITGTITLDTTPIRKINMRRIYFKFTGTLTYTAPPSESLPPVPFIERFYEDMIIIEENEEKLVLESGIHTWPIAFTPPEHLPPSFLADHSYNETIYYGIRVIFEPVDFYRTKIRRYHELGLITQPSPNALLRNPQNEEETSNGIILRAALNDKDGPLKPGNSFSLDVQLENPNRAKIKSISVFLVQYRVFAPTNKYSVEFPVGNLDLLEFTGKNYHKTVQLMVPETEKILSSFYGDSTSGSQPKASIEYKLKIIGTIDGVLKNSTFCVKLPVIVHSK